MTVRLVKPPAALLRRRIRQLVPGAHIVRLTATEHTRLPGRRGYVALVLDDRRRALPVPPGGARLLAAALQAAFPAAARAGCTWCWRAEDGDHLTELRPRLSSYPSNRTEVRP